MLRKANLLTYLGYKLFGKGIKKNLHKYYWLENSLYKAMIPMPLEMYIATAKMISFIFAVIGAVIGFIFAYFYILPGFPEFPIAIPPQIYSYWIEYRTLVFSVITVILMTVIFHYIGYFLFLIYPSTVISDRKNKIDKILPHAITFMYSLSLGGMNIIKIFKSLASYQDIYGEFSKEISRIVRDIELFGKDLRTALSDAIEFSPSDNFKEFLHGLITVLDTGGDITRYLEERSEFYFEKARQAQKGFIEFLGLMAETYITAFVAGPLFLIIIQTVMSMMGQGNDLILYLVIYMIIPVASIMFAILIKLLTPSEEKEAPEIKESFVKRPVKNAEKYEKDLKRLERKIKLWKIKNILKNPFKVMIRKPVYSLVISVPIGLLIILYGIFLLPFTPTMNWFFFVDDYIFLGIITMLAPYALFYETKMRMIKRYLSLLPVFLNRLAAANESGIPLYRAIAMIAKTDTSPLKKEIQKIKADLEWGMSLSDAFVRFANRLRVFELSRTVTLIKESLRSTGDVTKVLMISARDATNAELFRRERYSSMVMYTIIIYIAFFVFIGIVYIISTTFLSAMTEALTPGIGSSFSLGAIDVEFYKNLFMHAAVFQGIFAGLVAGVMGGGSFSSGVKHSIIMLAFAYVLFNMIQV